VDKKRRSAVKTDGKLGTSLRKKGGFSKGGGGCGLVGIRNVKVKVRALDSPGENV